MDSIWAQGEEGRGHYRLSFKLYRHPTLQFVATHQFEDVRPHAHAAIHARGDNEAVVVSVHNPGHWHRHCVCGESTPSRSHTKSEHRIGGTRTWAARIIPLKVKGGVDGIEAVALQARHDLHNQALLTRARTHNII